MAQNQQTSNPFPEKIRSRIIAGLFLLGGLLRLLAWYLDPILKPDSTQYLKCAKQWAESGTLVSDQPPLFLFLLKLLYQAGLDAQFWGVALNILFGMLFLWAIWKSAEVLFPGKPIVLCILFFAAVHPPLILLSVQILRDMPYLAVMGIFLWRFLVVFQKDRENPQAEISETVLLGSIAAIGCFFRHEAFAGMFFFILFEIVLACCRRRKIFLVRIPIVCAAFLVVFLLLGTFTDFFANYKEIYTAQYEESRKL